jgi:hypothetical protein
MAIVVKRNIVLPNTRTGTAIPFQERFFADEDQAVGFIQKRIKTAEIQRRDHMSQVYEQIEHFDGTGNKQWGTWNATTKSLIIPSEPEWRVRRTVNVTQSTALTIIAKISGQRPRMRFLSSDQDEKGHYDAQGAERWTRWFYENQKVDEKRRQAIGHTTIAGECYYKVYFDPTQGSDVEDPDTGDIYTTGRTILEMVPVWEVVADDVDNLDNASWMAHTSWITREQALTQYPWADDIIPYESDTVAGQTTETGSYAKAVSRIATKRGRLERVEFYHRPTPNHPEGFFMVTIGGKFIGAGPLPYYSDTKKKVDFPFVHVHSHIAIPGKYYHLSPIASITGLQQSLNFRYSSEEEYQKTMVYGRTYVEVGAVENPQDVLVTEHFGIVMVNPGRQHPVVERPVPIPPGTWGTDAIFGAIKEVSMVRDASRGTAQTNVNTAQGQFMMKQADDTIIGAFSLEFECAEEKMIRMAAAITAAYGATGEMLKIADQDEGTIEEFEFRQQFLEDVPGIYVEPGSLMPQDKMMQQAAIIQAVQAGIMPPEEASKRMDYAEAEDPQYRNSLTAKNRTGARAENLKLLKGIEQEVRDFQNHSVHLYQHELMRADSEYRHANPDIQALIDKHCLEHQTYQKMGSMPTPNSEAGTTPPDQGMPLEASPGMPPGMPPELTSPVLPPGYGALPNMANPIGPDSYPIA